MHAQPFRSLKRGDADVYTLVSHSGEYVRVDAAMWMGLRNFAALIGGWRPAGTEPPEDWDFSQPWSGAYDTGNGQLVTQGDALALANSLAAASTDVLAVNDQIMATAERLPEAQRIEFLEMLGDTSAISGVPQEILEAQLQDTFAEFRAFFRKGAFRIHESKEPIR